MEVTDMKSIKRFRFYVDFEKEEIWLNSMARKGYRLIKYTFGLYTFAVCEPSQYTYRIQLLENLPSHQESQEYLNFLRDSGIKVVDTHIRWAFLEKETNGEPFELFSDIASRIDHYRLICFLMIPFFLINMSPIFNCINLYQRTHELLLLLPCSFNILISILILKNLWNCSRKWRKLTKESDIFEK